MIKSNQNIGNGNYGSRDNELLNLIGWFVHVLLCSKKARNYPIAQVVTGQPGLKHNKECRMFIPIMTVCKNFGLL